MAVCLPAWVAHNDPEAPVKFWGLRPIMQSTLAEMFEHYSKVFDTLMNRFDMSCPDCKQGCNSAGAGGNEHCFHCDVCGLVECEVTSPALEETANG